MLSFRTPNFLRFMRKRSDLYVKKKGKSAAGNNDFQRFIARPPSRVNYIWQIRFPRIFAFGKERERPVWNREFSPSSPRIRNIAAYEGRKKTDTSRGKESNQGKRGNTKARSCPNSMSQLSGSQWAPPQCMILRHCLRRARHERVHRVARVPYQHMRACLWASLTATYFGVDFATRESALFFLFLSSPVDLPAFFFASSSRRCVCLSRKCRVLNSRIEMSNSILIRNVIAEREMKKEKENALLKRD